MNSCMVGAGYAQHGRPRAESGEAGSWQAAAADSYIYRSIDGRSPALHGNKVIRMVHKVIFYLALCPFSNLAPFAQN
eukprot:COSAG06_NODE_21722_length_747_cov_2.243827_2_plen_76_part_01